MTLQGPVLVQPNEVTKYYWVPACIGYTHRLLFVLYRGLDPVPRPQPPQDLLEL